jgi:histidinol-phosphatase
MTSTISTTSATSTTATRPKSTQTSQQITEALAFALSLADSADVVTMAHFRNQALVIETKADLTEVTIADRNTESVIRERILAERPGDGLLGEEHGTIDSTNGIRWIVDPIDGTGNYVRGVPIWATLIARECNGVLDVGVVSAPAMRNRWWAAQDQGAFADDRRLRVSKIDELANAFLSYSEGPWESHGMREQLEHLRKTTYRHRAFGDFWQHMLVAEGACDIGAEAIVSVWDLAAIQIIVEEAGGVFTDLAGNARPDGGSALSTNGVLHAKTLAFLSPESARPLVAPTSPAPSVLGTAADSTVPAAPAAIVH